MIKVEEQRYANGNIKYKIYYKNEVTHREDGPAIIHYYPNGNIYCESYYKNGEGHREDGPAYISYCSSGNMVKKEYYLSGEYLTQQEWFNQLSTENKLKIAFGVDND